MTSAAWVLRLEDALRSNPRAGFMTIATVEGGEPKARTVVFRGLAHDSNGQPALVFATDGRSKKVLDADSPSIEVCWWLERTSLQFRFHGTVSYARSGDQRQQVWDSMHAGARVQFFHDNGPLAVDAAAMDRQMSSGSLQAPPHSFLIGLISPTAVDLFDLGTCERWAWSSSDPTIKQGFAPPVISTR